MWASEMETVWDWRWTVIWKVEELGVQLLGIASGK